MPDSRGAVELASLCAEEVDRVGRRVKRVGDDGAVGEGERCSELSVDFDEQDGLRGRCGAVKLGQSCERPVITPGAESKRHAPFDLNWLSSAVREPVSVGSSAEVIRVCVSEGRVEFRENHVLSFQPQVRAARRQLGLGIWRLIEGHGPHQVGSMGSDLTVRGSISFNRHDPQPLAPLGR
jgi:hypothetical protein